ncbi:MAG: glycosyltransferase family 2 protein [Pseudomonadota bacterium]|nr:glycosyltransferase family 2 protein [Pseudomonadota bacterium]
MSSQPRFTVAIPTYNRRGSFLPEAIQGVLQQSFGDFELIVSDNGSTDGTDAYVRSLTDPRIRYIRHDQTMPAGEHFSAVAKEAVGEFLILHQDDDLLHKNFLKRANAAFLANPVAVMYGSPIWRQAHGHGYHSRLMRPREGHDDMAIIRDDQIVFDGNYAAIQFFDPIRHFLHPTLAVSNSALVAIGGFDPGANFQTDLVTQARLLFKGPLIYDPRPGGVSRVHPSNFMRTKGRHFRKMFFHNSYVELILAFEKAGVPWQPLLDEYLSRLSDKEVLACLFEWTYYRAPLELQKIGFTALHRKSGKRYHRQCLTKLGPRNLLRYWSSHWSTAPETSWSIEP